MSPLGSRIEHRDPGEQRLLDQYDGEARLAGSGHPDHDAVRRQVARADDDPVCAGLAGRRRRWRCRGGTSRGRPCGPESRVGPCSTGSESIQGRRRRSPRVTRPTGSGSRSRRESGGSRSSTVGSTSSSTGSTPRAGESVLLILQGLDASGKDGVIRRVFLGVNPIGLEFTSFRVPAGAEVEHDYLWRIHAALPARGKVGVFNRSHYEDVVAVRMRELAPEKVWRRRYEHIRAFERMLVDEGTDHRQGVPQRLSRGAARAAAGADRRPGEALEVPSRRSRGARARSTTGSPPGRRR